MEGQRGRKGKREGEDKLREKKREKRRARGKGGAGMVFHSWPSDCYELNYVPSTFIHCSSKPQDPTMWPYLEIGSSRM